MAGGRDFNARRFKELVVLFSERSADDEGYGMVKLNKLLYRADFEAYRLLGASITGEEYRKQDYGPVAWRLLPIIDDLVHSGRIVQEAIPAGPYMRKVPTTREVADKDLFSPAELAIIDKTLEELKRHGAKSVSDWSHETAAGWRVKKIGEAIPYSSSVINLEPLSHEKRVEIKQLLTTG